MSIEVDTAGTVPAPHGPGRRRSPAELEALARQASARFARSPGTGGGADEVLS